MKRRNVVAGLAPATTTHQSVLLAASIFEKRELDGIEILGMVQMNLTVPQAPERSSPVILSAAKDLVACRDRPFAALRVTLCD